MDTILKQTASLELITIKGFERPVAIADHSRQLVWILDADSATTAGKKSDNPDFARHYVDIATGFEGYLKAIFSYEK